MIAQVFDEKIVRIGDILEQIASLNRRIAFHQEHNGNVSTIKQYEEMREDFTNELRALFQDFQLDARFTVQTAR